MSERFDNAVNELSLAWRNGPQARIAAARVALEVVHCDELHALRSALYSAEERAREAERGTGCQHVIPDLLSGEAMICGKCGAVYLMDGQGWRAPETKGTEAAPVSPERKGATRG